MMEKASIRVGAMRSPDLAESIAAGRDMIAFLRDGTLPPVRVHWMVRRRFRFGRWEARWVWVTRGPERDLTVRAFRRSALKAKASAASPDGANVTFAWPGKRTGLG